MFVLLPLTGARLTELGELLTEAGSATVKSGAR